MNTYDTVMTGMLEKLFDEGEYARLLAVKSKVMDRFEGHPFFGECDEFAFESALDMFIEEMTRGRN